MSLKRYIWLDLLVITPFHVTCQELCYIEFRYQTLKFYKVFFVKKLIKTKLDKFHVSNIQNHKTNVFNFIV